MSDSAAVIVQTLTDVDVAEDFEAWFRDLSGPGYRLACAMLQDPAAAEDALQEATLSAWRNFSRLDRSRPPLPWFLAIVANCCRSGRRRRGQRMVPLVDGLAAGRDESGEAAQREDLRQALLRLKPDDRLLIVLFFYLDLPLAEVAQVAGMKLPSVKTRIYRAVKTLRPAVQIEDSLL